MAEGPLHFVRGDWDPSLATLRQVPRASERCLATKGGRLKWDLQRWFQVRSGYHFKFLECHSQIVQNYIIYPPKTTLVSFNACDCLHGLFVLVPQKWYLKGTASRWARRGSQVRSFFLSCCHLLLTVIKIRTCEERGRLSSDPVVTVVTGHSDSVMVTVMTIRWFGIHRKVTLEFPPMIRAWTLWDWPCLKANPSSTSQNCFF